MSASLENGACGWQYDPAAKLSSDDRASAESVQDLVCLTTLSANTILHAVRHRYHQKKIYTNVHAILLAVSKAAREQRIRVCAAAWRPLLI
jgi:hypothetical protein